MALQPAMAAPGYSSTLMVPQQYQASQQSPMQNIAETTNSANSVAWSVMNTLNAVRSFGTMR